MMEQYIQTNPALRYPIQDNLLSARDNRKPLMLTKEKVLKSQIRERVHEEKAIMDTLMSQCEAMLRSHNFSISDGKLRNHNTVTTRDHVYHTFVDEYHSFTRTHGSAQEDAYRLVNHPAWQAYTQYIKLHPMRCEGHLRKLVGEILRLQGSIEMQYDGIEKGEVGEEIVAEYLRLFEGKYIIKNNVMLNSRTASRSETAESDFCVITDKGIFVCEVKNIGNYHKRISIGKDGRWEIVNKSNGYREIKNHSPAAQNTIHCLEIESFLREKGLPNVPVIPVIIIANNAVDIENNGMNYVIRKEALYDVIRCDPTPSCLNGATMQQISKLLDSEHVEERAFDVETASECADTILKLLSRYLSDYDKELRWNQSLTEFIIQKIAQDAPAAEQESHKNDTHIKRLKVLTCVVTLILLALSVVLTLDSFDMYLSHRPEWVNARPIAVCTLLMVWTIITRYRGLESRHAASQMMLLYFPVVLCMVATGGFFYARIVSLLRLPTLLLYVAVNIIGLISLFKKK